MEQKEEKKISPMKKILLVFIPLIAFIVVTELTLRVIYFNIDNTSKRLFALGRFTHFMQTTIGQYMGKQLGKKAWEATYLERGLGVPPEGPREGFMMSRLDKPVKDLLLGWRAPETNLPPLIVIDKNGMQHYGKADSSFRILILGGSVGFGSYASDEEHTYFANLVKKLQKHNLEVKVTNYSTGAWTSHQEINALLYRGLAQEPHLVLLVDGLNDLTLNNDLSFQQKINDYLRNVAFVKKFCQAQNILAVCALQPFLPYKKIISSFESVILQRNDFNVPEIIEAYALMRDGLRRLNGDGFYFIDSSNVLSDEKFTTFTDFWHFTDIGHELLAEYLATRIAPLLKEKAKQ